MLDPDGTLTQQATESLRISEELYRRANETARRLSMQAGRSYVHSESVGWILGSSDGFQCHLVLWHFLLTPIISTN